MKEIVGAMINGTITNVPSHIKAAVEMGQDIEWLDRTRMLFMSACDLGIRWDKMAEGPTLFKIDSEGELHAP
jgi:hypothetical protein